MIAQFTLTVNIFICFCIDKCILVCYNVKATFGAWRAVVRALGERAKTIKYCFCEVTCTKQGVEGGLYVRHTTTMRLHRWRSQRCRRLIAFLTYTVTNLIFFGV